MLPDLLLSVLGWAPSELLGVLKPQLSLCHAEVHAATLRHAAAQGCSSHCHVSCNPVCNAVLDNLVKGAAGQALQNLNVMMGVPEETGLLQQAMFP